MAKIAEIRGLKMFTTLYKNVNNFLRGQAFPRIGARFRFSCCWAAPFLIGYKIGRCKNGD